MRRNPKDSADSSRRITRRGLVLGGAQLAFMGILGLRMRYMQVEQADQFRVLAEENRISIRLIAPARGQIYDRNGATIAENQPSYRIIMVREDAGDIDLVMRRLAALIDLGEDDQQRALKEMRDSRGDTQVTVADRVSWEDISKVAINAPALPGVTPEVGLSRAYPMGPDFAHVVGYVGPISDYDLARIENPDHLLRIPRFQIGKVGLESRMEEVLRGKAGTKRVEVNAAGRVMRELDRQEGKAGANIQLTVDNALQSYVQARLAGESAAAVVMDCATGDLLSIASAPSFDPNLFVRGISVADYSELTENTYRPLANKSVQGLYPPGSTYKMVTVLAALDAGVITPEETVWCPGHLEVSGRRFHCWKRAGHGHMNLETALRESCDVYYYDLALKVGIDAMSAMAEKLGIGVRFDLPMSAVARGRAPTRDWKRENVGQDWVVGDTVNASIGQGFVLTSPLHLAVMTARLAVGRKVEPRLIRSIDGIEQPVIAAEPLGFNENHMRAIRRAMFEATNNRRGTAYGSRIITDGYRMAGKTGTSQVRNITAAERARGVIRNEDLPWERRDHALFVNYAPYDDPRVAVAVVVEHGGGGSAVAAPVARDITLQALYKGDPPLDAYPEGDRARIQALQERLRRERAPSARPGQDRA
ncbi:penicillin-binding protein 2 [Seohaeicola saemankumensis]|uniref:Penicillin-binding protein 2 n=1 Tax=Seohaeicola saemankumensis TaxID=481181 RepID=A0ABW3TGW1_9RHOB